MKYLVMECHPGYVVLLDEEGRFVKAANFSYEVGQRIDDPILMERPSGVQRQRKKRPVHWKLSLAALAAYGAAGLARRSGLRAEGLCLPSPFGRARHGTPRKGGVLWKRIGQSGRR